jgi:putative molybdopterin biosynthesis protein
MTDEAFLTVAEVADLLKLNQQTVRNWIDRGELPAYRVGRRVRIARADFDAKVSAGATGESVARTLAGPTAEDFWSGDIPVGEAVLRA